MYSASALCDPVVRRAGMYPSDSPCRTLLRKAFTSTPSSALDYCLRTRSLIPLSPLLTNLVGPRPSVALQHLVEVLAVSPTKAWPFSTIYRTLTTT